MPKYVTPDFDVTVYEIDDKITADVTSFVDEEHGGSNDDWSDMFN